MSEPLRKCWVRQTYWIDDEHLEPGNPHKRVPFYLAADVEEVLEQCYHMIDQLQTNLGTGSLLKADAQRLLEKLR